MDLNQGELSFPVYQSNLNDETNYYAPSELVQISASYSEVSSWIASFVDGKRELRNRQNVEEFCGPPHKRVNCSRVDSVLRKKRDSSSLVQVDDIEQYWKKQGKKFPHLNEVSYFDQPKTTKDEGTVTTANPLKKVFTAEEISLKIQSLKGKILPQD